MDSCLFKTKEKDIVMYIIMYIDDLLIIGNDHEISKLVKQI